MREKNDGINHDLSPLVAGRVASFYASRKAQEIAEHLEVRREISDEYYVERRFYNGKNRIEAFCVTEKRPTPPPSEPPIRVPTS